MQERRKRISKEQKEARLKALANLFTSLDRLDKGRYYSVTEIQDWVFKHMSKDFDIDVTEQPYVLKKKKHGQFTRYLKTLVKTEIIEYTIARNKFDTADIKKYRRNPMIPVLKDPDRHSMKK